MAEAAVKTKRKTRGGHKAYVSQVLPEAKGYLEAQPTAESRLRIAQLKAALEEQLENLRKLDEEILRNLVEVEGVTDEDIAEEVQIAGNLKGEIKAITSSLTELLTRKPESPLSPQQSPPDASGDAATTQNVRVKLPKLEAKRFNGKVEEWQEFWDSYESSIHKNQSLSNVDKFAYLRGLVGGAAKTTIAGLALTTPNYEVAVDLLKSRFGKPVVIERAHVNELLNVAAVFSGRDTAGLRRLYDQIEIHHRGLKALGIDASTYEGIAVPSIVGKLPEVVRLQITRGKNHTEWKMDDLLKELISELELREEHCAMNKQERNQNTRRDKEKELNTASALLAKMNDFCAYCKGGHAHQDCDNVTSVEDRRLLLRKYGRCFICARKGHISRDCNSKIICSICKGKHHVSICYKGGSANRDQFSRTHNGDCNDSLNSNNAGNALLAHTMGTGGSDALQNKQAGTSPTLHVGTVGRVALQTAQAVIKGDKRNLRVRVLFDAGSHRSFITTKAVQSVGLSEKGKEWIEISTFGQQTKDSGLKGVYDLQVFPFRGGNGIKIEAYEVPTIAQISNEHIEIRKTEYPHLQGLWFSDVNRDEEILGVDVLIGADYLWCFQKGRTIRGEVDQPVAVETCLGWVLSGPLKGFRDDTQISVNLVGHVLNQELQDSARKLWDFETLGIREENEVHEALKDAISFNGKRYEVGLPWKEGHGPLPNNYRNSVKRLKGQIERLKNVPENLKAYDEIIKEQAEVGIIERVPELEAPDKVHYLPHHAVIRNEAKTTKVRVVYDASSKESKGGVSLNDCLHVGPTLSPLLYDILIRFREKRVALVGDIEKAFLNVEVKLRDRDCLRFLWVNNVESEQVDPVVYRFCRVVFGVNCSPFLLNATLQYHLDAFTEIDPEFVRVMKRSFYVDDLVTGDKTTQDASELHDKAKTRLALGGFKLRKWLTNSEELREKIRQCELRDESNVNNEIKSADESYAKEMLGRKEGTTNEKVLGLSWNCNEDLFNFELFALAKKADGLAITKRSILKIAAGMYDPLGIISPILVSVKVLFQELCSNKVEWDEELKDEEKKRWVSWIDDLKGVNEISVPRCVYRVPQGQINCSLHGFADASKKAYCAVVYFVCEAYGAFTVTLLTSKTRVAPLKTQTIPRLELMSGRVLAKLMETVQNALKEEVEIKGSRMWLDSKTALWWINNRGEWKQFVRQRVNEILRITRKEDWAHCPGEQNPADVGSRGELASRLKENKLWWRGPAWLSGPKEEWPVAQICETPQSIDEEKKMTVTVTGVTSKFGISNVIEINAFSRLGRLLRVTAWVKRFPFNLQCIRNDTEKREGMLCGSEIAEAERIWIKSSQDELKSNRNYEDLATKLKLMDHGGLLRCKGRLENSDLEPESQQPIIIPRDHKLTKLMIEECHRRTQHSGIRATLGELRSRFWVPKGRQAVKKVLKECVTCKKAQGKPFKSPPVAALPDFRVRESTPFSKVGIDFAGPLFVKSQTGEMAKCYLALFTCCVTRAVHLDLVADLTATTFVRCLRKFVARRGVPSLIISDNAKTFKASAKVIKRLYDNEEVRAHLESNRIDWKFILERAPWWGGFYERMVGTAKRCLRKVLGNAKLNADELLTVLTEVEATLNSRPLTYEYDEVGAEMLTPSHLIYGRRLLSLPEEARNDEEESETGILRRFRYLARLRIHFWNRWRKEYLTDLREHHRGKKEGRSDVSEGEVVLVHEDNVKRSNWKMGKVLELIAGKDGEVRGAKLKLITKGKPIFVNRAVQKLYPLEVCSVTRESDEGNINPVGNAVKQTPSGREVPRRAAALDSRWRTRVMLDH